MLIRILDRKGLSLGRRRFVNQPALDELLLLQRPGIAEGQGYVEDRTAKGAPDVDELGLTAQESLGFGGRGGMALDSTTTGERGLVDVYCI